MQKLQKYRELLANSGWVVSLTAVRQVLGLLLVMVLVRVISKEEFGQYQFVVAALGVCGAFAVPGLQNAILQSVARGFEGTYRAAVKVILIGGALGSLSLVGLAMQQWYSGNEELMPALIVAAICFPLAQGCTHWISYQAGKSQFRKNTIYQSAGYSLSYAGAILSVYLWEPSVTLVVLITNGVLAIQNTWISLRILKKIDPDAEAETGAIDYGIKTSIYGAFNVAGNYIDKFLLFFLLSPESLAVYAIAERIPELLKNYLQSIRVVLVPGFSRKSVYTKSLNRKLKIASLIISAGILVLAFGIIPWLLPLAFTEAYGEAVLYCQLLLGTIIIGQNAATKFTFLMSRLDTKSFRDITIGTNIIRLLASAVLVPILGIYGAIVATFIYRLSIVLMVNIYIRRFNILPQPDN